MKRPVEFLSLDAARRVALRAQGFGRPRPTRDVTGTDVVRTTRAVGVLQLDSVNVLVRSHYLPVFSRLGPYARDLLDQAAYSSRRRLFEYWGHAASLIPVELQPLFRWRMERARRGEGCWGSLDRFGRERATFCSGVLAEIRDRGPLGISELAAGGARKAGWWEWSEGKLALEWLFWTGQVSTHSRRHFERVYDLTERVLPRAVIEAPTPPPAEAQRQLLRIAVTALGVATERDLADYFRLPAADARARIAELVESGELVSAAVEGWDRPAFLDPRARAPRRVEARALLSPFDSLVWERGRAERLFGFRYRLEIYTPSHRRLHGYYVLPFLLGDRLVGRVDLKADRARGALRVVRAHCEPWAEEASVAGPLRDEIRALGGWLDLDRVVVSRARGFTRLLR
ncbi:MAG: YcaQ family DNA glycosylase [Holophagales bacterium]|nr:YcaQ family DNA glycosylase [Holophagales bacterium]